MNEKAIYDKGSRASRAYLDNIETPYVISRPEKWAWKHHNLCHLGLKRAPTCAML